MANTNLTISMVTKECLAVLENNLTFAKGCNREYDDQFAIGGAKIGDTINIRKPARYAGRTGATMSVEDHTETSVALQLDTQFGVDINFTSKELSLSIDEFSDRIIKPAMAVVANKVDAAGLLMAYQSVYNTVGTPGTVPTALKTYLQAGAKMDYEAAPRDGNRSIVLDPTAQVEIVDALKGLFQSGEQIKSQYEKGNMGLAGGFKWSMDQNIYTHTVGPLGGTPLVNGATAQGATTLVTDGWTASAANRLKKGDVFTIANVFAVNPQTRVSTGQLRQFVVTADTDSSAGGAATIPISPAIASTGAFATVNALPADNAALTILGAANTLSPQHLAYHKNAFVLGCADLLLPKGVDMAARISDKQLGLSARMVRQYDIVNDKFPCRFDILFGWKALYPELACRIAG
ncbi:Major capsid protein Gp5 [uncultured Caudovirales phage]|uniref:Major capsid protein Gp5 n=1 Tax=uncultured Caudovirales phage TaxID=2100421 RepID=A0A6J5N1W5_9CAUD|nr:Major capsid protein Gp5 [uncultured Caudovirales phage]